MLFRKSCALTTALSSEICRARARSPMSSPMEEVADNEACLAALPPELFVAIAKASTVKSLGRLASSCHQFQAALAVAEEAWAERGERRQTQLCRLTSPHGRR